MPISVDRIRADIEAIARFTESPGGADRPTFSSAWRAARDYVIEQAKQAGCKIRIDAAGNVHARPALMDWDAPVWLSGSHLDSVPHGGNFDGVAGVVVPLDVLRSAREDDLPPPPLELIIFAEEEGTTFGVGMLGSHAWMGDLLESQLAAVRNARGENYVEAGAPCEVRPSLLIEDACNPRHYLGFIELHIEQGPGMWNAGVPLAVVTAIAGRKQYRVTLRGVANHAGSTSMADRKDALAAAAVCVLQLEGLANGLGDGTVITVGRIDCLPNAVNVIPATVEFTIDFRSPSNDVLADGDAQIRQRIAQACGRRGIEHAIEQTDDAAPVQMDADLCARLSHACADVAGATATAVSGALHDAAVLAPRLPAAMLFVPSRDGISHNPAEFSRVEDIALAAGVLQHLVMPRENRTRMRLLWVNSMSEADFVGAVGPIFEHSPWIAQRTYQKRPFHSVADLHAKLMGTLRAADDSEKLGLIRAHPDLVGKTAREGKLSRESTTEQIAAGLINLSPSEIELFDRYNRDYRERFGFPFVICARENKKDAILADFPARLQNNRAQEIETALAEIEKIARLRLVGAIGEDS